MASPELWLGILGVLLAPLGILTGILVTRHYYRKGRRHSLSPFLHSLSRLLSVDPAIVGETKIVYRGREVHDLHDLQILVANDGEQSIRDCIRPLEMVLPQGVEIFDHSIVHRHPAGRDVQSEAFAEAQTHGLRLSFPLLNEGEFFIVKTLCRGYPEPEKIQFRITAEGLPPTLKMRSLSEIRTEPAEARSALTQVCLGVGASSLALIFAAGFLFAAYLIWRGDPTAVPIPWPRYEFEWGEFLALAVTSLWGLVFLAAGVVSLFASVVSPFRFRKRPYFPLPAEVRRKIFGHRIV